MNEPKQVSIADWARQIPVAQIPSVIVYLAARLVAEGDGRKNDHDGDHGDHPDKLVNASELADYLNLPESWVRNEERLGHIPSLRLGKYVRFNLNEVEKALAQGKRQNP